MVWIVRLRQRIVMEDRTYGLGYWTQMRFCTYGCADCCTTLAEVNGVVVEDMFEA